MPPKFYVGIVILLHVTFADLCKVLPMLIVYEIQTSEIKASNTTAASLATVTKKVWMVLYDFIIFHVIMPVIFT